jgi:nucleoredoxin
MKKTFLVLASVFATVAMFQTAPTAAAAPDKESAPATADSYHAKLLDKLKGSSFVKLKKSSLGSLKQEDVDALRQKKYIFIYFSASWCPPCRKFTPELVKFYNQNHEKNGDFDILLVSSDRNQAAMDAYMKQDKMPWAGIKLAQGKTGELKREHKVRGIPHLILLDENDKVLATGQGNVIHKYQQLKKAESKNKAGAASK